jgi:hypothetical protein
MYTRSLKPVRVVISRFFSFILLATIWFDTIIAAKSPVASVVIEQQERGRDFVVTFAHPFKKGDVKDTLLLKTGNEVIPSQVNVKRRYSDGSVKHATISTFISEAVPGQSLTLDIYSSSEQPVVDSIVQDLPNGFSAEVIFRFPDGSQRRANAAEFYRKASSGIDSFRLVKWLQGPLTSEVQLVGPPSGTNGELDPDLQVIFGLRAFKGGKSMRVEVVVESPWLDVPGNIPYDVTVFVGGKKVMAKTDVGHWNHRMPYWLKEKDRSLGHFAHARWRKIYWWGSEPPDTHIRYELPYLVSTLLIPPYDTDLVISSEQIDRSLKRWQQSPRGVLENGIIMAYFPTTGGREDLGPYPTWTTRYLFSQDNRTWKIVLGTGDLAGSFPIHIRDRKTGRIFSIDKHPGFSLNPRGTLEKIPPRPATDRPYIRPRTSPYQVDNAHQPSLAFVPYLLTGDYYYLEEAYFWANWCMLIQNAAYRQKEKGLIAPDQTRGEAWALRQLVDAAKIAPDSHPEKKYFDSKVRHNLQYYYDFIKGPDATPLGTYTLGASDAYVRGRSPEERRKWLTLAPWQQNFLVWSLDHATRAGYSTAAGPRDYFAKLQIGMLNHSDAYNPDYATPYFLVIGERSGEKKRYYNTWDELFKKTFRVVAPDIKPGLASGDYGGSYSYIARATLLIGTRNELPGADNALRILESRLPQRDKVLLKDPTWAFTSN